MSLWDYLFGDAGFMGGMSIKTGLAPNKWRPGRRSTEIRARRAKAAQNMAAGPGLKEWLEKQRARVRAAQQMAAGKGGAIATAAAEQAAAAARAAAAAQGVFHPATTAGTTPRPIAGQPPRSAVNVPMMSSPRILAGGGRSPANLVSRLSGLVDHFYDGMGDASSVGISTGTGTTAAPGSGGGNIVIDPVTGQPIELPPGFTIDAGGNLVPADPAAPTTPDGKPYTGNAQVWVSQESIPFYWDPLGAQRLTPGLDRAHSQKLSDPVLYPDGTPVTGLVWLPRLNLEALSPDMFRPSTRGVIVQGQRGWPEGDGVDYWYLDELPGYQYKGTHSADGDLIRAVEQRIATARAPWGPVEPWGPRAESEVKGKGGGAGGSALVYYMATSFDWSVNDPSTAAYPFLYDWFAAQILHWKLMPADLWLSTGVPISQVQQGIYIPYQPSPLLHCLDFLDALAMGSHGMPKVLDLTSGHLDFDGLAAWCAQDPKWAQLGSVITAAKQRPFLIATIYDVTEVAVGPGVNKTVPVPAVPPPPVDPLPPLAPGIDPNTGLPYSPYIDPNTGLPYGPYTSGGIPLPPDSSGGFVDWSQPPPQDPNAPQFLHDGEGYYSPDPGPGYPDMPPLDTPTYYVSEPPGYSTLVDEGQPLYDPRAFLPSVEMPADQYDEQNYLDDFDAFPDDYEWAQRRGGYF